MTTPNDIQPGADPPEPDPAHSANAEAAKWRHRAKDSDERADAVKMVADAMAVTNDALLNQVIEQRVAPRIAPTALPEFMARIDSSTVVNDQGGVDFGKLDAALEADLQAHPHIKAPDPRMPAAAPAANVNADASPYSTPGGSSQSWGDVLGKAARGE